MKVRTKDSLEEILREAESLSIGAQRRLIALLETQALAEEVNRIVRWLRDGNGTRRPSFEELLDEIWMLEGDGGNNLMAEPEHWRIPRLSRRVH